MKICSSCGAQCQDTAKFCTNCGAPFGMVRNEEQSIPQEQNQNWQQDPYRGQNSWQQGGASGPYGGQYGGRYGGQYGSPYDNRCSSWQQTGQQNQYGGWQQGQGGPQDPYGAPYGGWQQNDSYGGTPGYTYQIRHRSIALAIIFTIITFGIYGIYWMIKLNDEVNQMANEPDATSGGLVFLFSLITFGIYSFYWLYRMGERCDAIRGEWNGNRSILYLILGLVGFSIISYALMQDVINKSLPYPG